MSHPQHQYIVTPWKSRSELLSIRTALYNPPSAEAHSSALATILAWKLRGNIPHAVEATGALFLALSTQWPSDGISGDFALRATYATALARFVTGYADLGRHRSGPARSMLEVAREIGLPAGFVEVRHEVAHEDLPSLGRLVGLAREAVGWLWEEYWAGLKEEPEEGEMVVEEVLTEEERREAVKGVLRAYRKERVAFLRTRAAETKEPQDVYDRTAQDLIRLAEGQKRGYTALAKSLCVPGMLIPVASTPAELDKRMQPAFDIWQPLLTELALRSRGFMKPFLSTLAITAASEPPLSTEHRGLCAWLNAICTSASWASILGDRRSFLLVHTIRSCLLDMSGSTESTEAVCKDLLSAMPGASQAGAGAIDIQLWTNMYAARFGSGVEPTVVALRP